MTPRIAPCFPLAVLLLSACAGEPPPPPAPPPAPAMGGATEVAPILEVAPDAAAPAATAKAPEPSPIEGDAIALARNLTVSSALASDGNQVYWMNDADGTLMRIGARGGIKMVVYSGPGPFIAQPSLALDRSNVYWTMQTAAAPGSSQTTGTVMKQDKTGGNPTTIASGIKEDIKAINSDNSNVYWISGSTIMRVPAKENAKPVAVAPPQKNPTSVAGDGQMIYWTNRGSGGDDGAVLRISIVGGGAQTFAAGQEKPSNVTIDGDTVYWVSNFKLMKQAKKGATGPTQLAANDAPITDIAIDDTHVYWVASNGANDGVVKRVPKAGGAVETIESKQNRPAAVAVDETNIYWLTRGTEEKQFKDGTLYKRVK